MRRGSGVWRTALFAACAAAALVAAVAVPPAAAKSHAVKLSLLPLQKAQLGAAGKSFSIAAQSGVVSNATAAAGTTDTTTKQLTKLGRVSGYQLLYGEPLSGGGGVTGVTTNVEQYKSASDAKQGLAFWNAEDYQNGNLNQGGFQVSNVNVSVPAVGTKRYAFLTGYRAANIAPVS